MMQKEGSMTVYYDYTVNALMCTLQMVLTKHELIKRKLMNERNKDMFKLRPFLFGAVQTLQYDNK